MTAGWRRLGLVPTLATVAGIAVTAALGNWQLNRAAEKQAMRETLELRGAAAAIRVSGVPMDAADIDFRRVEARGRFDPMGTVFIDNRTHRGTPGYHVVMPLRIGDGTMHVLVNRGWVAAGADRRSPPKVSTPEGEVAVSGLALVPAGKFLELSPKVAEGNVWQNLMIERYRQATKLEVQPFVIQQTSALDDGLVRDWPAPDLGIHKHYGYAFQWFALAATLLVFYLVTHVRKRLRQPQ
jgi:surfeit locus 1 family protein